MTVRRAFVLAAMLGVVAAAQEGTADTGVEVPSGGTGSQQTTIATEQMTTTHSIATGGNISVVTNSSTSTFNCDDKAAVITGNRNNLKFVGPCSSLTIAGNDNRIEALTTMTVTVSGSHNEVTVSPSARVMNVGNSNVVKN